MSRKLIFALAFMCLGPLLGPGPVAYAHPPLRCQTSWWIETDTEVPLSLTDVPPDAAIMLPIEWAQYFDGLALGAPNDDALREEVLEVEARDIAGVLVDGSTFLRQMPFTTSPAVHRPWWRPSRPLEPGGRYTLRVRVKEPSREYPNIDCPWTALNFTLTLDIASSPVALAAQVTSVVVEEGSWPLGYGACESVPSERHCEDAPRTCCPEEPLGRIFSLRPKVEPFVGWDAYYLASYEIRSPYITTAPTNTPLFPMGTGFSYLSPGAHGPLVPDGECARVTIQSLLDDTTAVSPWTCARPGDFIDKVDDGFCDAETCRNFEAEPRPGTDPAESTDPGCAHGLPGATLWWMVLLSWRRRHTLRIGGRPGA